MWKTRSTARILLIVALASLASGCASVRYMKEMPAGTPVAAPGKGKAQVVFMRSTFLGKAIGASVFEIKNDNPELVGLVANDTKQAYEVNPGRHLFMVVSESADYLSADLAPNRTYYVFVTPRMGAFRARFSLAAVTRGGDLAQRARDCLKDCRLVQKTSESEAWARDNMSDIRNKHRENYPRWDKKPANEKPHLAREDGV